MATNTGHVMNLANSIIGVSLLAMPFCFKQCGITLAIVMLILSSIISRLACYFLVKSSTMCRRRNFEFLAFYTFGPSGKLLVELGVIGFMMGTCVAFFVVMGDLGPAIISKIFNISNNSTLRTSVLIGLGFLVVLPLGLLRNVESLAAISTVTIGFYLLFILKIFFESSPHLINGDWWYHVNFWQPEGILQCIPIFAMALSCQTQLFEIYDSLPTPTIDKMNSVVRSALNLCTIVYASVGLLGYIAYCKGNFTGNILLSFSPSLSSEMFKLGFVLSIAVSFPLVIFPCRASLFSLIFKRVPIHHELSQTSSHIPDSRFKCLTIGIVSVALITGLLIPSIELVLGFVGSTIGIAICVIFPSLSFLNLNNKNTNERVIAKMTLIIGLIIMIMGTFGNLFAAVENRAFDTPSAKLGELKSLPQLKLPPVAEIYTESTKNQNKGILLVNPIPPEKLLPQKPPEVVVKPRVKLVENRRKEPPIPVAPVVDTKQNENVIRPQIQVIEGKKKPKDTKELPKKAEIESKNEVVNPPKPKPIENINKDAIEKENREIMELEKQKKTEDEEKQMELLKRLKEHQDEQKKLLQEQEKILIEIKHRENEKKSNEVPKETFFPPVKLEEVKLGSSDSPKSGGVEIKDKNVIETGNIKADVLKPSLNVSNEKQKIKVGNIGDVVVENVISLKVPENKPDLAVKKPAVSIPLPLAKLNANQEPKASEQVKQNVLNPEVPVVEKSLKREERDVAGSEVSDTIGTEICSEDDGKMKEKVSQGGGDKTEKTSEKVKETSEGETIQVLIKNSERLSVGLGPEEKTNMADVETSKLMSNDLSQPLISKKRDLKSVKQTV